MLCNGNFISGDWRSYLIRPVDDGPLKLEGRKGLIRGGALLWHPVLYNVIQTQKIALAARPMLLAANYQETDDAINTQTLLAESAHDYRSALSCQLSTPCNPLRKNLARMWRCAALGPCVLWDSGGR